eukprot:gnl/TRDRNA2_/TRDRNA2_181033_c0_seq1.p1 gnl/TRDRNA2_/TRDRNA2_181033_c0~~gnl/TRDRNA2_/TRDRNA2_181033_c0_seq1.p1  ORF type:complete len:131 (-),score=12.86 gnl/TRDRNA2_/TRDRNA2_181033_c0_seq1:195-587(-)
MHSVVRCLINALAALGFCVGLEVRTAPVLALHTHAANATKVNATNHAPDDSCSRGYACKSIDEACEECHQQDTSQPCYYYQCSAGWCAGNSDLNGGSMCSVSVDGADQWILLNRTQVTNQTKVTNQIKVM